jgi:hypothetical protein
LSLLSRYGLVLLFAAISTQSSSQEPLPWAFPPLPAQGFIWMPQLAPQGPTTIVVSLQEQRAYVYRNGVRIGVSKVSTGKPGYETPTGVFTILEKQREHYSNRYDNAPMPFMQRLTWGGVALHAGNVPAYPASHGCIRLPYAFSELLFDITTRGMTVIVSDTATAPTVVYPGLFAANAAPRAAPAFPAEPFVWTPDRSPSGPMTLVLSAHDREVVVLRNAIEIGRAPVAVSDGVLQGTHVYLLLQGSGPEASMVVPGRPALRWLAISLDAAPRIGQPDLRQLIASGQLRIDPEFAARAYDALKPGTSLVVTDEAIRTDEPDDVTVLQAEQDATDAASTEPR